MERMPESAAEEIPEVGQDVFLGPGVRITSGSGELLVSRSAPSFENSVVFPAFLGIVQDFVSRGQLLESCLSIGISWILVRMVF